MTKIILGVLIVTIISLIGFAFVDKATTAITTSVSAGTSVSKEDDSLTVSISGEVKKEGTFLIPLSSTLVSLLEAAGGANSNADPKAYDADISLVDGESYYIAPIYDNSDACSDKAIEKVNINSADKTAILEVGGFTTSTADSLVEYRSANGSFKRIEDIKNVYGIGKGIFEKVKNFITLMD